VDKGLLTEHPVYAVLLASFITSPQKLAPTSAMDTFYFSFCASTMAVS